MKNTTMLTKHFHIPEYLRQNNASHLQNLEQLLLEPASILKHGGLIAFPTETVYGLGASIYNDEAVKRIFKVKDRPQDNPLIAHIGDFDQIFTIACIDKKYISIMRRLMPGPITFVSEVIPGKIPNSVTAGLTTIAVRMPDHLVAQKLINLCGFPVVAPSANISGKPSCTSFDAVVHDFDGKIDGIIDGGSTLHGIESTVVSLVGKPIILRPGIITKEDLQSFFPAIDYYDDSQKHTTFIASSPGMRYRHYMPKAAVIILSRNNTSQALSSEGMHSVILKYKPNSIACLLHTDECERIVKETLDALKYNQREFDEAAVNSCIHYCYYIYKNTSIYDFARTMYYRFRSADRNFMDMIFVESWSDDHFGFSVMNRLNKAATEHIII